MTDNEPASSETTKARIARLLAIYTDHILECGESQGKQRRIADDSAMAVRALIFAAIDSIEGRLADVPALVREVEGLRKEVAWFKETMPALHPASGITLDIPASVALQHAAAENERLRVENRKLSDELLAAIHGDEQP